MSKLTFDPSALPDLKVSTLRAAYRQGMTVSSLIEYLITRLYDSPESVAHPYVWITQLSREALRAYAADLDQRTSDDLPLYGIPFAIKDNIDLAHVLTTAACPAFAYTPSESATVVQRLIDAGAIPLGKTNLDQFATGLNGTRSPYGIVANSRNADYIAGGSSSGSAVAVALGWASFALGTDTAGSGRVPAAFNGITGLKPSCGLLSTYGVVPACRTLDCVSIFAQDCADTAALLKVAQGFDAQDAYSRDRPLSPVKPVQRIGIPASAQLAFFGDAAYEALYQQAVDRLRAQGYMLVEIDFSPFLAAANLLYSGPWVAERYHVVKDLLEQPDAVLSVIETITRGATHYSAEDCFAAFYRLADFKRTADQILASVDVIMTPTAGTVFSIAELQAEPIQRNTALGYYTNFMNLLDYSALAVPAGQRPDGMPFGVTFFAPAMQDLTLLELGQALASLLAQPDMNQVNISNAHINQTNIDLAGSKV